MTETEIEYLKRVLSELPSGDNSPELDARIIDSARTQAKVNRDSKSASKVFSVKDGGVGRLMPLQFLRSSTLAIVITIGAFFIMSQMIIVDQQSEKDLTADQRPDIKIQYSQSREISSDTTKQKNYRVQKQQFESAPSTLSRDEILMEFELSEIKHMLVDFSSNHKSADDSGMSTFELSDIQLAMTDIDWMIETGELDKARWRYDSLRADCKECGLPNSLEALVIATQTFRRQLKAPKAG